MKQKWYYIIYSDGTWDIMNDQEWSETRVASKKEWIEVPSFSKAKWSIVRELQAKRKDLALRLREINSLKLKDRS